MNKLMSAATKARDAAPRNDELGNSAHTAQPTAAKAKQTRTISPMEKKTTTMNGVVSCTRADHGAVKATSTSRSDMQATSATNRQAVFTAYCGSGGESRCIYRDGAEPPLEAASFATAVYC